MPSDKLYHAQNGITIRQDREAMFGFLPDIGFAFFAPIEEFDLLRNALSSPTINAPEGYSGIIEKKPLFYDDAKHVLGSRPSRWTTLPIWDTPLVINWMITGNCNFHCVYCYAKDLMNSPSLEPDLKRVRETIENIRICQPVAVVITGGEPILSPYLEIIINELTQFSSVVIDTNATLLTEGHVKLFAKKQIHIRVSIDSPRPQINAKTRLANDKKKYGEYFSQIMAALILLNKYKVPTTINTVATTKNYDDVPILRETMQKFGVRKIRVRPVEKWGTDDASYLAMLGSNTRRKRFEERLRYDKKIDNLPPLYYNMHRPRNSIILVSPWGVFYTESELDNQRKIVIDENSPFLPDEEVLKRKIDVHAHSSRYLKM